MGSDPGDIKHARTKRRLNLSCELRQPANKQINQ
jgi:hypothetical protein